MEQGVTWYEVLGVMPGAEQRKIKREYEARSGLLGPQMIAGAPSNVLKAVTRAQDLLEEAWRMLSDPERRRRYDEQAGLRRTGGGLGEPGSSRPTGRPSRAPAGGWAAPGPAPVRRSWPRTTWVWPGNWSRM